MIPVCWSDWCTRQLADLSRRLLIQGYDPTTLERLRHTRRDFSLQFTRFENSLVQITEAMAVNPEGYHHYDDLTRAKADLLEFTGNQRGLLFEPAALSVAS